jgi:hypothetical protein
MAAVRKVSGTAESLPQSLANDLRLISNEAKKKYPAVREASERCLMQVRKLANDSKTDFVTGLKSTNHVIHSLLYCCDCKFPRIVELSLTALQKLIVHKALKKEYSKDIVGGLRGLLGAGVEEVRVIQTLLLLVTTHGVTDGPVLADIVLVVLSLAVQDGRNPTLAHTASAAVGQMVSSVFDGVTGHVDEGSPATQEVVDAFNLFQDICLLTNGDKANWLPRTPKMNKMLGLELIEATLKNHTSVFLQRPEFSGLVKERVCPLTIKLFSPSSNTKDLSFSSSLTQMDKPNFPLFVRLVRILVILVSNFFSQLVRSAISLQICSLCPFLCCLWQITECEIFLSLLVKFMETDRPGWQQILSVEAINILFVNDHIVEGLCLNYDMEEHANNVLLDLVGALGGFIQACFSHPLTSQPTIPASSPTEEDGTFYVIRSAVVPVVPLTPSITSKPVIMSMVDKMEPSPPVEGYSLAIGVDVLMNLVSSICKLTAGDSHVTTPTVTSDTPHPAPLSSQHKELNKHLLMTTWSGMLAALSLLLDACGDEMITENILKAHLNYIHLCGRYHLAAPRDAFLTSLCRSALPGHYAMTLVTGPTSAHSMFTAIGDHPDQDRGVTYVFEEEKKKDKYRLLGKSEESKYNQLHLSSDEVEVKTKPTKPSNSVQQPGSEPTELNSKRLQCIRSLVNLAQCYADYLEGGWGILLQTLHHLTGILGLQPQPNGSLLPVRRSESTNVTMASSPGKKSTLNMLCDLVSNLFESSQHFSDTTLSELINALCQVSKSVGGASGQAGDVCMFSEAKLLEVTLSNLYRIELIWEVVVPHFMQGTKQPNQVVRQYCCDAVITATKLGLKRCEGKDPDKCRMFLSPLAQLTESHYEEVRSSQLNSIMDLLQSCGEAITSGWHEVLMIVGSAADTISEQLVRNGFQALQLIATDYLQALPLHDLPLCIVVGTKFALQHQDINVSLTAIGLLWSLADFIFQNSSALEKGLPNRLPSLSVNIVSKIPTVPPPKLTTPFITSISNPSFSPMDRLWLMLFASLGDVCMDDRGAVRKSGSQTLFSTVTAHGTTLQNRAWNAVLWMVLYPLLDTVNEKTNAASTSNIPASYLMHHSRNTAQKQWVETQALTLSGVSRLLQSRWRMLRTLEGFGRIWSKFCASLLVYGQSEYEEVVNTVLKCIKDFVSSKLDDDDSDTSPWMKLWNVWINLSRAFGLQEGGRGCHTSQAVLVEYFAVCLSLIAKLHGKWKEDHIREFGQIAVTALAVPIRKDTSPFLVPSLSSESMPALQYVVLLCHASLYSTTECSRRLSTTEGIDKNLHKIETLETIRRSYPVAMDNDIAGVHPVVMETLLGCLKQVLALLSSPPNKEDEVVVHFGPFVQSALYHSLHLCESCHVTNIQSLSLFLEG